MRWARGSPSGALRPPLGLPPAGCRPDARGRCLEARRWRQHGSQPLIEDGVTDNRYLLGARDLPDAETLRARGITRVVYAVEDRGEIATEEDDVHEVMAAYEAAGLGVHLVDFAWCEERADRQP